MTKYLWRTVVVLLLFTLGVGGVWLWQRYENVNVVGDSSGEVTDMVERGEPIPLLLPPGFDITIAADNLPGARVLAQDVFGNFWVSQTREGTVSLVEMEDGVARNVTPVFTDLNNPHGLAIDSQSPFILYIAEEHRISKVSLYSEGELETLIELPSGGRHTTRTIAFGPDERLYVSIGSSCDVCIEEDPRRGALYSLKRDGSDMREYADGLRNAVFFTWSYVDGRMWATEMGRDWLGDDLPPDEINIIEEESWYGWPWFYGDNIEDTKFDPGFVPSFVKEPVPSYIPVPAHSAPLGLAFVPEEGWPEEYWYDLFVSYHGSWNRSTPAGYKVVRMKLDAEGNYSGTEDFITGWLDEEKAWGRPVDILIRPGGVMYLTDDRAGVIYRVVRTDQ